MLDCFVEGCKVVTWNVCIHMMLGVVIHVPIPKLHQWVAHIKSAGCAAKIVDNFVVVEVAMIKSDMLCTIAQPKQPAVVERAERYHKRNEPGPPMVCGQRPHVDVTEEHELCPPLGSRPTPWVFRWITNLQP